MYRISNMKLKYNLHDLKPHLSEELMYFHYEKHYKNYVNNLNNALTKSDLFGEKIEKLILNGNEVIYNNSSQVFNHEFYFNCMSKSGGGYPNGKVHEIIKKSFNNFKNFKDEFNSCAMSLFGSGWVWFYLNTDNCFLIDSMKNADSPIILKEKPILVCDLWEHAYYLDYKNDRKKYLDQWWNLINWDFVNRNVTLLC